MPSEASSGNKSTDAHYDDYLPSNEAIASSRNEQKSQFTLRALFLGLTIAAVFCAGGYYVKQGREWARWMSSRNDFRQIGLALLNFNGTFNSLPYPIRRDGGLGPRPRTFNPGGRPLYSWRYAIIHYVAAFGMGLNDEAAWDDPANASWSALPQPYSYDAWDHGPPAPTATNMFAITGPETAFGDGATEMPQALDKLDGDTILVVEVRNSGTQWMEPGDFDIRTMPHTINAADGLGISSRYRYGFHVIFSDGAVWCLSHETPFDKLEKFGSSVFRCRRLGIG